MGIFDKLKKILVGENTIPSKSANNVDTNPILIKPTSEEKIYVIDKPLIIETAFVEMKPKQKSIEEMFCENEDYIFKNIIWNNLFNEENKYSDSGVIMKTKKYIKQYFEDNGFDWNANLEIILNLITSSPKWKAIAKQQDTFYEYFCINKMNLKFEGHFSDWVKFVIDESYSINKPLTKQYARILVGYYYFKTFNTKGTKEALYKNLLAMTSYEEFKNWISKDVNTCFERLIKIVIKRFSKMDVQDLDERVLIIQLIQSKNFTKALSEFDYLDSSAKQSAYSNIYNEANGEKQVKSIDLNVKNIITEDYISKLIIKTNKSELQQKDTNIIDQKYIEKNNNLIISVADEIKSDIKPEVIIEEKQNYVAGNDDIKQTINLKENLSDVIQIPHNTSKITSNDDSKIISVEANKDEQSEKTVLETKEIQIDDNDVLDLPVKDEIENVTKKVNAKEDEFDKALKKLGGARNVNETDEIKFLNSIVDDLENIEKEIVIEANTLFEQTYDESIDELSYF